MDGTIQVIKDDIRVEVALLDVVLDFEAVWRGSFEGKLKDLFSLQHQIAFDAVRHVDPEQFSHGNEATASVKTAIGEAHKSLLTAIHGIFQPDRQTFMLARELLARAIELDPDYSAAHEWMAYWGIMAAGQGCGQPQGRNIIGRGFGRAGHRA